MPRNQKKKKELSKEKIATNNNINIDINPLQTIEDW